MQNSDEIPEAEPARSNYKNLKAKNKQNKQAAGVLSDIATVIEEKGFEVLKTIATEQKDIECVKEIQNQAQVLRVWTHNLIQ